MAKQLIRSKEVIKRNKEDQIVVHYMINVYNYDGRFLGAELTDLPTDFDEEDEDRSEEDQPTKPEKDKKFVVQEMDKNGFRKAVAAKIGESADMDKVNKAVQASLRVMRRKLGELNYSTENVSIAIDIYNEL